MKYSILNILIVCLLVFFQKAYAQTMKDTRSVNYTKLQGDILRGWNTWNNPNLLSHVLMPEGLALQIVFRKKRGGPYYLRESYISSPKHTFPETITPKAHAYNGSYIELVLSWQGMQARIQSATEGDDLVLLYTPLKLPEDLHLLILESGILWNKPGTLERRGDQIIARFSNRAITIQSTHAPQNVELPFVTPYLTFDSNEPIGFCTGKPRTIEEMQSILKSRSQEHQQHTQRYRDLAEAYNAMQSVIAWNIIYDANNDRAIVPVSRIWNEAWGGYIIFDWDTYFTAFMLALDQKTLAYSNAIAMTNAITEQGFIPNLEASFGVKSFDRSQPPVGSLICKLIYDKYKESWFLEEVYDELLSWNRWWTRARDNQGYLSWGSHPHPQGMQPNTGQAAKWESGLDNSPLFDDAVFNERKHLLELASVGLMSLYIADCHYLAEIASTLGKQRDMKELKARAKKYSQKLRKLWDDDKGIYRDKDLTTNQFTRHLAPTNFYPLLAGVPTQPQAERMINEHFFNRDEFYGEWMLPSIARNDPGYSDNSYWRGRIWAPMNFLVYLGLRNYNLPKARKELVEKSLKLLLKEWKENQRVHENYNAETGVGSDVRNSDSFYAWGGLLGMIALMENGYW